MAKFEKGQSGNPEGRKPGTENKVKKELRSLIVDFFSGEIQNIHDKYSKLSPRDQLKFLADLAPYALSKLSSVDLEHRFESLSDEQLEEMYSRVVSSINNLDEPES